jgi:opacity protein-like surface antigen
MRTQRLIILALALAGAPAGRAADPADIEKELQALKARLEELERAQKAAAQCQAQPVPAGMTEEQQQEFNRIAVKAEAMEDARDASGLKGLKFGAYLDPVYSYNADLRQGQFQFLTPAASVGYGYSTSYIGTVALDVQKETENGTKLRVTLIPARSSADVAETLGGIVHEASFSIPLGSLQTRFIGGQIPDWSGYEMLQPTLNKLVTHNLLFDFTLPGFYTGAGLELVRGKWDVKAVVANLTTTHRESFEHVPVLAYRGDYSGGEFWGFGFAGVNGKARNYQPDAAHDSWLDLFEVDGYYTRGSLNLQGQLGAGHQKQASITPDPDSGKLRDAMWVGASALASYKLTPRLEAAVRGDYILNRWNGGGLLAYSAPDDRNGIGPSGYSVMPDTLEDGVTPNPNKHGDPGKGADRFAVTVGGNYALTANATVKAEYRFDGATQPVFRSSRASDPALVRFSRTNHLASASVVLFF